ncbi:sulfite exporter TauE/SafE family protein [Dongshaea marina]|uniref:sulfite exporter TauE/SafE family protein n=1 Tax=Dongshaea marina TaxID=2047966 RepID=UPI000D3E5059|nr:sulfite exporter TauE/SafE family protein [Dongshaea marina]
MSILLYMLLGAAAGTLAGLFGIGGGLVIIPVLTIAFQLQGFPPDIYMHLAIGTSLATIVFTSLSSIWAHHQRGGLDWTLILQLGGGIIIGAFLGGLTANAISGGVLAKMFGVFVYLMAIQIGLGLNFGSGGKLPGRKGKFIAGGIIGWVSALFGTGGGSMTVPYLNWCQVPITRVVSTSAACGFPIALSGCISYILTGWHNTALPDWSLGYVYLPAWFGIVLLSTVFARFGARLAHTLPPVVLKRSFAVLLLCVGTRFVFF